MHVEETFICLYLRLHVIFKNFSEAYHHHSACR